MFKVGDEVEFTDECERGWWFGPRTEYKSGIITGPSTIGGDYKYEIKVTGRNVKGLVGDKHIILIPKIIPYSQFQTGDTEEDI